MPKCFKNSLFTFGIFFVYLFIFDFIWTLIPNLSDTIILIGTIAILLVSFRLAIVTSNKFFQLINSF